MVGVDLPDDGYWLGLFVVPAPGHALDDELKQKIVTTLRTRLTARHVPDEIVAGARGPAHADRQTTRGADQEAAARADRWSKAANIASVDDPDALRWYARFATDMLARLNASD